MHTTHYTHTSFEDARWKRREQKEEYRHHAALSLISADTKNILDIGCGDGTFLSLVRTRWNTVDIFGTDFSSVGLEEVKKKIPTASVVLMDVHNTLPFSDNMFDTVTVLDVLEHSLEPEKILAEIHRVAKKECIVSVPNFSSLPARLQVLFGRVPENNRPKKGHMYWFTYKGLHTMLRQQGFSVEILKTNYQAQHVPVLGYLSRVLCAMHPSLFALSFVVRARKIQ